MPRLLLAAGAVVFLIAMTGCDGPSPHVTVAPTPSATAVFASDEEALAAAEASYAAYLAIADEVFADGGADAERLREVATGDLLETELKGFKDVTEKGWRSTGGSTFDSMVLQRYDPHARPQEITVYLCDDISAVDVVGPDGTSVVSPTRPSRTLFQATFEYDATNDRLLISDHEVWSDEAC